MKLKHLFLLSTLLLLSNLEAAAQPTHCETVVSAYETCSLYYSSGPSDYIFVGRVLSLETTPSGYGKQAQVAVVSQLKGQLPSQIELTMFLGCFGIMGADREFIFIARRVDDNKSDRFYSYKWSTPLDDIPPEDRKEILKTIRAVVQGVPQPRIVGTVVEHDWYNPSGRYYTQRDWLNPKFGYDPHYAHPLVGIVVLAVGKDGRQFKTTTDSSGYFHFDELPAGAYAVRPILQMRMDTYANGTLIKDEEENYITIGNKVCGVELNFDVQQTGIVRGRLEREKGEWGHPPRLTLTRAEPWGDGGFRPMIGNTTYIEPTYIRPTEIATGTLYEFGFEHVPIGLYFLDYSLGFTGDREFMFFYYPAVLLPQNAEVIRVEPGKIKNFNIKIPFFKERGVFGQTVMPDGTRVEATIQLIDLNEPNELFEEKVAEGGQFNLRVREDRLFSIQAFYVLKVGDQFMRHFSQPQSMILNQDTGPITLTLDQVEPY